MDSLGRGEGGDGARSTAAGAEKEGGGGALLEGDDQSKEERDGGGGGAAVAASSYRSRTYLRCPITVFGLSGWGGVVLVSATPADPDVP